MIDAGAGAGIPVLDGLIGSPITLTDTGASPVSRVWQIAIYPSQIVGSPPTVSTPTSAVASFTAPANGDGFYKVKLTRTEHDGTTTVQTLIVGVVDEDGIALPSPGISDQDFVALGASAVAAGFAGSAHAPQGDILINGAIRRALKLSRAAVNAAPVSEAFSSLVEMKPGLRRQTWTGGSVDCVLTLAQTGLTDGASLVITFLANTATGLVLSERFNTDGSMDIDPRSKRVLGWIAQDAHMLLISQVGNETIAVLKMIEPFDSSAPLVTVATVGSADPDAIYVEFDDIVDFVSTAEWSLTGAGGRTITAIESGTGTKVVVLTLSSPFDGSESSAQLHWNSSVKTRDLNNNKVNGGVAGFIAITLSFTNDLRHQANWTVCLQAKKGQTVSGGKLVSWTDQVSLSNQMIPSSLPDAPTVDSDGACSFTGLSYAQRCDMVITGLVNGSGNEDYFIYKRIANTSSTISLGLCGFDGDVTATVFNTEQFRLPGAGGSIETYLYNAGTAGDINENSLTLTGYIDFFQWRVAGTLHIQIDVRTPITGANSKSMVGITRMRLGSLRYSGGDFLVGIGKGEILNFCYIKGRGPLSSGGPGATGNEITDIRNWRVANQV